jgi:hypothetical protein
VKPPNLATIAKQMLPMIQIFKKNKIYSKGKSLKQTCFKEKHKTAIYTKITHVHQHTFIRMVENGTDLQILDESREKRESFRLRNHSNQPEVCKIEIDFNISKSCGSFLITPRICSRASGSEGA